MTQLASLDFIRAAKLEFNIVPNLIVIVLIIIVKSKKDIIQTY
jgi:hypothetical protein